MYRLYVNYCLSIAPQSLQKLSFLLLTVLQQVQNIPSPKPPGKVFGVFGATDCGVSENFESALFLVGLNASTIKTTPSSPSAILKALAFASVFTASSCAQIDGLNGRYLMRTVAFSSALCFASCALR